MPDELPVTPVVVQDYTELLKAMNTDLNQIRIFVDAQSSEEFLKKQEAEQIALEDQLKQINASLVTINKSLLPSSKPTASPKEFTELLTEMKHTNTYLSNLESFGITLTVGLGLVIGIIATTIFSRYLKH